MERKGEATDISECSPDRVATKNLKFLAKLIPLNTLFFLQNMGLEGY